jgi:hypothetical protein
MSSTPTFRRWPMTDVTLREFINRDTYPFPAGSAADRFARQLAHLVPDWCVDDVDYNVADDLWMSAGALGAQQAVAVTVDRPDALEWTVDGSGGALPVRLTLGRGDGSSEFAVVIRVLRMLGVLPEEDVPAVPAGQERSRS